MKQSFRNAFLLTLAIKVLFYVFGYILRPDPVNQGLFFKVFMENDSYWYQHIFDQGYPLKVPGYWEQCSFAFFPLYPVLLKGLSCFFASFANSAFVLSLGLSFLWVKGIFKYMDALGKSTSDAFWLVLLLQCIPFHYFFHMFYTELLFSTLLFWLMYSIKKAHFMAVFILCILIASSRPTGLLFAFTLFLTLLIQIHPSQWLSKPNLKRLLPFIGAPIGIGLYASYCYARVGRAFIFRENMSAWQRDYCWPWESFETNRIELQYLGVYAAALLLIGLYAAYLNKGKNLLIILPNLILPLCTGTVTSYPRYVSVNHPIFEKLLAKFTFLRNPWFLALLFLGNLATFAYWVLVHDVLSY
jgi:hypothetical protein